MIEEVLNPIRCRILAIHYGVDVRYRYVYGCLSLPKEAVLLGSIVEPLSVCRAGQIVVADSEHIVLARLKIPRAASQHLRA